MHFDYFTELKLGMPEILEVNESLFSHWSVDWTPADR